MMVLITNKIKTVLLTNIDNTISVMLILSNHHIFKSFPWSGVSISKHVKQAHQISLQRYSVLYEQGSTTQSIATDQSNNSGIGGGGVGLAAASTVEYSNGDTVAAAPSSSSEASSSRNTKEKVRIIKFLEQLVHQLLIL